MSSNPSQTSARAVPWRRAEPTTAHGPRFGIVGSLVFHALIVAAALFSFRNFHTPQETHMVPVDLVTLADTTNVAAQAPPAPPKLEPEKIDIPTPQLEPPPEPQLAEVAPAPDAKMLRESMKAAERHLDYVDYLLDHRSWIGGATMSLADLAAAAQISVADYLGGIDWKGHDQTASWYGGFKSRPSFQPLLSERMEVIGPPKHYANHDF